MNTEYEIEERLGEHLIEHAHSSEHPYTMEEIDAMLEESEHDFEAGRCCSTKQVLQMCREALSKNCLLRQRQYHPNMCLLGYQKRA